MPKAWKNSKKLKQQLLAKTVQADMGVDIFTIQKLPPIKKMLFRVLYSPTAEFTIFVLVILSVVLLVVDILTPSTISLTESFTKSGTRGLLFWGDLTLTVFFVAEYICKLWIAPKKMFFFRATLVDLLAIVPLIRVFRIVRLLRVLKLLRLIRAFRTKRFLETETVMKTSDETSVVAFYLLFSVMFGTIGILIFEKDQNAAFSGFSDGLWWCLVTLTTVGYGDLFPITIGGKVVAVIIMFIGLSFYAILTGTISTHLIERTKRRRRNMIPIESLENHTIICGWNKYGEQLLENLLEDSTQPILIVSEWFEPQILHHQLFTFKADPSTEKALTKANISKAKVVIIIADMHKQQDPQTVDAKSILIALAIANRESKTHVIVELLNSANARHAKNAGVDEVIISGAFTGAMIAQTAASPGLTSVFGQLFGDQTVWLTTMDVPKNWEGLSFYEATSKTTQQSKGALVGLLEDGSSFLDPPAEIILKANHKLILIRSGQTKNDGNI